jgi:hypothetical protein
MIGGRQVRELGETVAKLVAEDGLWARPERRYQA